MKKNKYTKDEVRILTLITNFCQNECGSCQECPEDLCVLWNIEQIITERKQSNEKNDYNNSKNNR